MSALSDDALRGAGLFSLLEERLSGGRLRADDARLTGGDLLALGALADRVRHKDGESNDVIEVHPRDVPNAERALQFLRDVAIARITAPDGAKIRVYESECGQALAPVALGFGASEVVWRTRL